MESETASPEVEAEEVEEKGPALYNPKALSLVASLTSILSWVVLVAFIGDVVAQYLNVQTMIGQQGMAFSELFKEPGALSFLVTNLSTPFFTGIALFLVMQAVSIGLNVLMELDLKTGDE
jgi:hypothetical protein